MTEHTPGPWTMHPTATGAKIRDAHTYFIAGVGQRSVGYDETLANARLIAAAPELLALAERVAAHFDGTDAPLGEAARAVIHAATEGA